MSVPGQARQGQPAGRSLLLLLLLLPFSSSAVAV